MQGRTADALTPPPTRPGPWSDSYTCAGRCARGPDAANPRIPNFEPVRSLRVQYPEDQHLTPTWKPGKNPEADIERRKGSFMLLGLLTAVAITLVALEWTVFDKTDSEMATLDLEFLEEEAIPPSATPPHPRRPPAPTTVLEIVEDDEDIEEVEIEDTEVEEDFEVEIIEEPEEEVVEEQIFTIVEEMPSFPGGEEELFKYLGKSIKYPQMAADAGISGWCTSPSWWTRTAR